MAWFQSPATGHDAEEFKVCGSAEIDGTNGPGACPTEEESLART